MAGGCRDEFFGTDSQSDSEEISPKSNESSKQLQEPESPDQRDKKTQAFKYSNVDLRVVEEPGLHSVNLVDETEHLHNEHESSSEGSAPVRDSRISAKGVSNTSEDSPLTVTVPDLRSSDLAGFGINGKVLLVRFPSFLGIEYEEFDRETWATKCYENEVEVSTALTDNPYTRIENTVRWRYKNRDGIAVSGPTSDTERGDLTRESNSKLVMWSDGSYSLLLGSQLFDAQITPNSSNQHLAVSFKFNEQVMKIGSCVRDIMMFRLYPSQKASEHLKGIILSKHVKRVKTKGFFPIQDPEKYAGDLEKLEMEKNEARKQLRAKRMATERKYNRGYHRTSGSQDMVLHGSEDSQHVYHYDDSEPNRHIEDRTDNAKKRSAEEASHERITHAKYANTEILDTPKNDIGDKTSNNVQDESSSSDGSDGPITQSNRKRRAVIHHDELE